MKRRSVLSTVGILWSTSVAGCLQTSSPDSGEEPNTTTTGSDFEPTPIPETKSTQGAAKPLSTTTKTSTDEYATTYDRDRICLLEASTAVLDVIESELDTSLESVTGVLSSQTGLTISLETLYDRDGDRVRSPNVGFEEVVAVTPRQVQITATIDGKTYECENDVTVRDNYRQNM